RRLGDEERQDGELRRAGEDDQAHRDRLELGEARGHHRHARDDPPGNDPDEERQRGESGRAQGGIVVGGCYLLRFPQSIATNFSGARKPLPQSSSYFVDGFDATISSAFLPCLSWPATRSETSASMSR